MAKEKGTTEIVLQPGDGAIIIREDGRPELYMPQVDSDDEEVSYHHTLMVGFALGLGERDERLHALLMQIFEEKHQAAEARGKMGKK